MRLAVFDVGLDRPTRFTLALMKRLTRTDPPEVFRVASYRHRYFGSPFHALVQDLMRGPSAWTVAERELFAAYTSNLNRCQFCVSAHAAFTDAYAGTALAHASFNLSATAPLLTEVRAVLGFLDKMAHDPDSLGVNDVEAVREAGVVDDALDAAVRISALFHVINRVMDTVGATALEGRRLAIATRFTRVFGYRLPPTIEYLSRQA